MRWTERTWPLALLTLAITGLLASLALNVVVLAPNRLLTGHGYVSIAVPSLRWLPLAWVAVLATDRMRGVAGLVVAMSLLAGLLAATGLAAGGLLEAAGEHARVQLGAGFWCMATAAVLLVADRLREIQARPYLRLACWTGLALLVVAMAAAGVFDRLSIVQEFALQRARFITAVGQHLLLAFAAAAAAVALGAPLAIAVAQRQHGRGATVAMLNLVQTIPSMALFALLVAPLAWLGVGGTGNAPALVALTAYALLPVVRYTLAGLATAPFDCPGRGARHGLATLAGTHARAVAAWPAGVRGGPSHRAGAVDRPGRGGGAGGRRWTGTIRVPGPGPGRQ